MQAMRRQRVVDQRGSKGTGCSLCLRACLTAFRSRVAIAIRDAVLPVRIVLMVLRLLLVRPTQGLGHPEALL